MKSTSGDASIAFCICVRASVDRSLRRAEDVAVGEPRVKGASWSKHRSAYRLELLFHKLFHSQVTWRYIGTWSVRRWRVAFRRCQMSNDVLCLSSLRHHTNTLCRIGLKELHSHSTYSTLTGSRIRAQHFASSSGILSTTLIITECPDISNKKGMFLE